ncbi:hypothetical protein LX87_02015 [Larkinella arboricola]|uniref:Uncharacterized protein n=2 Tax=Larkinella arboricola TaxID=643671 RepID=A0A327X5D9_LARAB|nr:hypothetical protein LX87_02015 [Larkinella arboricola]
MVHNKDTNLPNYTVIENRWLAMVNEIQQQHTTLLDLIEKLEQNPTANPKTVFKLTRLQQHVLDTLNVLLAESISEGESISQSQLPDRLQRKYTHSQILVQLKQQIDQELDLLNV